MTPVIYLAGAIRDGNVHDIRWREDVMQSLDGQAVFLNPLGGKQYDPRTRRWTIDRIAPTSNIVVKRDAWCIDRADIVLAHLTALRDGYPCIGTLIEIGRAWRNGALIYLIDELLIESKVNCPRPLVEQKRHPFFEEIVAASFETTEAAIVFLARHLGVLSGADAGFDGEASLDDDDA